MFALTNAVIYTGYDRLEDHAIIINGSRIEQVCPQDQLPKDIATRDMQGAIVSPVLLIYKSMAVAVYNLMTPRKMSQ